jgi:hypothetical protein
MFPPPEVENLSKLGKWIGFYLDGHRLKKMSATVFEEDGLKIQFKIHHHSWCDDFPASK